ncbi:MAG: hypothetical protein IBX43_05105 [Campylobacterales bacterium]|nr:hypothetical protein [Campylobacterales bacterium]
MAQTLKEIVFESRDTLVDIENMLMLVEKNISELEVVGEEVTVKGCSAILWSIVTKVKMMECEMGKSLRKEIEDGEDN